MKNNLSSIRKEDDDLIERRFVTNYSEFALRMNFFAIVSLLEKARSVSDPIERKSICLSGLQLLYSSYEDFAILLHAFRNRIKGRHLHLTIGVEEQTRSGSSAMPRIFKQFGSARQMMESFGFTSINHKVFSTYLSISITEEQWDYYYQGIADSIKHMGDYQETFNEYKNKLKHGKPVVESIQNEEYPDKVVFLSWTEQDKKPILELSWVEASLEQIETATIQGAKIYIMSLEFLCLFMLHYYPDHADKYLSETVDKCI